MTENSGMAVAWTRRLTIVNLGLASLQPISAGFLLSGYDHASMIHAAGAAALLAGAFSQAVTAIVSWLRRGVSGTVAALSVWLLALVVLEAWAGRHREYWLHVPVGVGLVVWLRQVSGRNSVI